MAQLNSEEAVRRAKAADIELFGIPAALTVNPSHKTMRDALTKGEQPLSGLTTRDIAVTLADIAAQEPAGPARVLGDTARDLDAAAFEEGSQVGLGAAR